MSKRKRVAQSNMRARYIAGRGPVELLILARTNPTRDDDRDADRQPDTESTGERQDD